jgi:hypothetical protein
LTFAGLCGILEATKTEEGITMSRNAAEISARALRANTLREITIKIMALKPPEEIVKLVEEMKKEADELTKI